MSLLRSSPQRHPARWQTWLWAAGAWVWMAQAVLQNDGVVPATAQASLGTVSEGLSTAWTPPVPAYRPSALQAPPPPVLDAAAQIKQLSSRGGSWYSLTAPVRLSLDQAARAVGGRPPWRQLVIEGTGEHEGSAIDLQFALAARPAATPPASSDFYDAHFVIGNGTRSGDGTIERTARAMDSHALVIALVGDFAHREPTAAQLRALTELVDYARAKIGIIPAVEGDASRAPLAGQVLKAAYNSTLSDRPVEDPPRI